MNGIDKITARILADAQKDADNTLAQARQQAEEIRRRGQDEARALRETLAAQAEADARREYELRLAAGETAFKKQTLALKQELVAQAFERAVEKLRGLDEAQYVGLLAALAAKASETGGGEIILNPQDRERCGEKLVAEANRLSGGSMTLSAQTRPLVGGFILSQGSIEINCALDTLAALRKNELSGETARLLFS